MRAQFLILILLAGCAAQVPVEVSQRPPPANVRLGPELTLLGARPTTTTAVMGSDGRAHIVVMLARSHLVHHLVVGAQGVEQEEIVTTSHAAYGSALSTAIDAAGRLHVVDDTNHFVREGQRWQGPLRGPACQRLLLAGQDLVCVFLAKGKEVGSPGRWDWFGIYSIVIWAIPWHVQSSKAVIAREAPSGASSWTVLDRDNGLDVDMEQMAVSADDQGTVNVLYMSTRGFLQGTYTQAFAYARIETGNQDAEAESSTAIPASEGLQRIISSASGREIREPTRFDTLKPPFALATDPESGFTLGLTFSLKSWGAEWWWYFLVDQRDEPVALQMFQEAWHSQWGGNVFLEPRLAPAGMDRFHAVFVGQGEPALYYLPFSDGNWSATLVRLGRISDNFRATKLIADREGNALAIWVSPEEHLVGRWIRLQP
ncbi:hypothetical protein [Cupriavidus numazuensis]|uniref:Uncharacterized protein n=1 Tax=Cupriavidus numazuensis TaxID=221992 RepID=A0ABM8TWW6_9BURK|nr:hypothetical protein [Cupriavidus numazuensis]CAG2161385.1 hypothetical protein LMG26411_08202 [Cupriavidus numazuensis]